MNTQAQAYPLSWPPGFPRRAHRERGAFKTKYDMALANVARSLKLFGSDSGKTIEHAIMSSNITLTDDQPSDPGVAVWFTWDGDQRCIPVDRYDTAASNLQAIHHIIEARRVELRHGTLALVRATFEGFKALPAPAGKSWREVLGIKLNDRPTSGFVRERYKALAQERHPDKESGSSEKMSELNNARDIALREIGG